MQDNLNSIVNMFRNAIIAAKENFRFSCKDRMHRFPHGCCDDASDLLGYYCFTNTIYEQYRSLVHTVMVFPKTR